MRLRGMEFSEIDRFKTEPTEGVIAEYARVKALISENLKGLKSFNKFFKRELKNAIWE